MRASVVALEVITPAARNRAVGMEDSRRTLASPPLTEPTRTTVAPMARAATRPPDMAARRSGSMPSRPASGRRGGSWVGAGRVSA